MTTLRKRLEGSVPPELKRRIVEALVEKIQADTTERGGVPQSEITIFYRFSQPNEAAALVLPKANRLNSKTRLPEKLETIGDHLLRRRVALKLIQRQVATKLEVGNEPAELGSESVETDSGIHARHHPIPCLQSTAARDHIG